MWGASEPAALAGGICLSTLRRVEPRIHGGKVHKIRKAMSDRDQRYRLSGLVEVDEGRFGGEEACAACPTAPASRFADRNEKSTKWGNREQGVEDLALGTLLSTPSPLRSVFAVFPAGLSSVAKKRSSPS
jgi:hypothetical protein